MAQQSSSTTSIFTDSASSVNLEFYVTEDHNLIDDHVSKNGVYAMTITAAMNDYPLMDEFVEITSTFTMTITDVCTDEAITSAVITDMTFQIRESPYSIEQDFVSSTDVNAQFCGTLFYTLSYVTGPLCSIWDATSADCTKSLSLITLDQAPLTKLTIDSSITPLLMTNPYGVTPQWYDHSLLGEHEYSLTV